MFPSSLEFPGHPTLPQQNCLPYAANSLDALDSHILRSLQISYHQHTTHPSIHLRVVCRGSAEVKNNPFE